ncbi:hypothetical protein Acr_03g0006850 [Actinidia rufa]|uniref:Uncharacterized protein n=1 Tax=Actinidia rufa TaxID=165716 RepID=A0A7J0EBQ0_9ERIC|nr:hypothetical protein Acr_03g0006850 [Actinidia rufa]
MTIETFENFNDASSKKEEVDGGRRERSLIEKYGEMGCDGTLAKMKTREKKYRPIALYVNSAHHVCDPITYPWQWTWKDVSTKVQNMRHQYSLVKQKIKKNEFAGDSGVEEFDWVEGLTHWSNFLRYKDVFGDVALVFNGNDSVVVAGDNNENGEGFDDVGGHGMEVVQFGDLGHAGEGDFDVGFDGGENGVMGLDFEYDAEEGDDNHNGNNHSKEDGDDGFVYEDVEPSGSDTRKKGKVLKGMGKKAWGFLASQLSGSAKRNGKKERKEREEREKARVKVRRQRIREWEAIEKESEERGRKRREDELLYEREWEERMNRRRSEWKTRLDEMLSQHRVEMGQIQTRILHEQQNLTSQLLGIVSQWTGHPTGLADHSGATNHYLSQMMQNLHHVNGIVHGDTRGEGDNQDDQFIVDE